MVHYCLTTLLNHAIGNRESTFIIHIDAALFVFEQRGCVLDTISLCE